MMARSGEVASNGWRIVARRRRGIVARRWRRKVKFWLNLYAGKGQLVGES